MEKQKEILSNLLLTDSFQNRLQIGQIWHDKNHCWTDGSTTLDMIHLILSADMEDGKYYWKTATFMWCGDGYKGAHVRDFLEEEIRLMECIGTIEAIKRF